MHKIGIIGDEDSIGGFITIGLIGEAVSDNNKIPQIVQSMINQGVGVIYMTEELFLSSEMVQYREQDSDLIVIPIPSVRGTNGVGLERLREMTIRAIGSDITNY